MLLRPAVVLTSLLLTAGPAAAKVVSVRPPASGGSADASVEVHRAAPVDRSAGRPLAGKVIVLDPGHQLGNSRFPRQINTLVSAGPSRKPCNTTGTATNAGYPEATFVWKVALAARRQLEAQGAQVLFTRGTNSRSQWGPCVDVRGRAGNSEGADAKVSIHADGSHARGARGFHVIAPASVRGWADDIAAPSRSLALAMRGGLRTGGFPRANYIAGGDGLDVRSDLGTLNLSDVPTVMVELGNMRNGAEARRMTRRAGQAAYARALVAGLGRFLG